MLAIRSPTLYNHDVVTSKAAQALEEFHGLFQGDMTVHACCSRLKIIVSHTLRDVGDPISDALQSRCGACIGEELTCRFGARIGEELTCIFVPVKKGLL
jgi:hypothetical protein